MKRAGRILILDDKANWRKVVRRILVDSGFDVVTAASVAELRERLTESFYHLMILDIRMDESNPSDVSGMDLLRELHENGITEATKVIMLSAFGTREHERRAFRDYNVVDFQEKANFGESEFRERVAFLFREKVKINLNLDIQWQQIADAMGAVVGTEVGGMRIKRDSPQQRQIAEELEDLLCRLFYTAASILARPLAPGHSGTTVLWVQPFYASGAGHPVVVKFGDANRIEAEFGNFESYVKPYLGAGRTSVEGLNRTPHLGGIIYSHLGTPKNKMESFAAFYQRADIAQIQRTLEQLFLETCHAWYANCGLQQLLDLTNEYEKTLGFNHESLVSALNSRLKSVEGKEKLYFRALPGKRAFTNPLGPQSTTHQKRATFVCMTHGDLNDQNVLVDDAGLAWLIDFQRTGHGHILRDLASLDCVIRIQLLGAEEATLQERLDLEEMLMLAEQPGLAANVLPASEGSNPAVAKIFTVVTHLRGIVQSLLARNPEGDMSEYYIALLYHSLNALRFYSLPVVQREHAILSASLLFDQIGPRG